jgi:hypothetical protein
MKKLVEQSANALNLMQQTHRLLGCETALGRKPSVKSQQQRSTRRRLLLSVIHPTESDADKLQLN